MKTLNKIFLSLGIATAALGFSSCVDDLDQTPTNPSAIGDVSNRIDGVFADLFFNFSTYGANGDSPVHDFDGGMASFQRAIFIAEEMPTDEACWLWDPGDYGNLNYGIVTPDLNCLFGFYSRLQINITLCNDFIRSVNDGAFADADAAKTANYVNQAKTLRALCYFYMCSFYPNVPYSDEATMIGSLPVQRPRAEVFELMTSELEQIVASYAAGSKPVYGYVGRDAAQALLAKYYLNAEAFTGTARWDKAYSNAKAVIDNLATAGFRNSNGKLTGLAKTYKGLFAANNKQYVLGNAGSDVNEIIWTLAQDAVNLLSYSGATFLINGWIGTNGVSVTEEGATPNYIAPNGVGYTFDPKANGCIASAWYNAGDGWKCMVARKSFVRKFDWDDAEMGTSKDERVAMWGTSAQQFTSDNISLVGDDWGKNGYLAVKFSNWNFDEDGNLSATQPDGTVSQYGGDYPVIRLAEMYLTAAEAIMNGGGGSQAEATEFINNLRERAGIAALNTVTLEDVRNERCRELYQENSRRTDLIRYNQWSTGYNWEWKGGSMAGANLPAYTRNYPLPSRVMGSGLVQTPGY